MALIEAAKVAGVPRFVFISANIPNVPGIGEAVCVFGRRGQACRRVDVRVRAYHGRCLHVPNVQNPVPTCLLTQTHATTQPTPHTHNKHVPPL